MDRCKQVRELLADYRTGILSSTKAASVAEHLRQCSECANELRVLDDVLALVQENAPECDAPVGLWNGIYNRITSPEPRRRTVVGGFGRWISDPIRAAGVAVAAAALAIGLVVGTGPHNADAPVRVASNVEYVQRHALYAGQAPLADRVSYLSVVAASSEADKAENR